MNQHLLRGVQITPPEMIGGRGVSKNEKIRKAS